MTRRVLRPAPSTRRRLALRVAALLAVLVSFVGGPLQVGLHLASHTHVVCAAHGGALEDAPTTAPAPHLDTGPALSASDDAGRHTPCDLPPALQRGVGVLPAAPGAAPPALADARPSVVRDGPDRATGPPRYRLAPKTSPPVG